MSRPHHRRDNPYSPIARFFLWCAGSDIDTLEQVPRSESIKQIGFGTLVVVPAVLALFAMTYALSTLTENPIVYLAGGLVWATIVFSFDRFIISTFRKSDSTINDITSTVFLSRLVFATFVGIIVAHPLVMLYFHDSVEERLALDGRREVAAIEAGFAAKQGALVERIDSLKTEVRERERERNEYQALVVDEIDGIVSGRTTGIPGRGASAEEKKLQLNTAQLELDAARDRNLAEIGTLNARIEEVRQENIVQIASFEQARDYLARAEALAALAAESAFVRSVQWFLIIFFVFVDTLPILFKGFTPAGPYDHQLRLAEYRSGRETQAERDSLERTLYPHMVLAHENRFVADRGFEGIGSYAKRYREFLAELARHQQEFLAEWQGQHDVLARMEDADLRQDQLNYMDKLRKGSVEVVNRAIDRFLSSLAWESRQSDPDPEAL